MVASLSIGNEESRHIELVLETSLGDDFERPNPGYRHVPRPADQATGVLANVSSILNDQTLYELLMERNTLGKFQAGIGSTNATSSDFLVDTDGLDSQLDIEDDNNEDQQMDDLYKESIEGHIDLDDIMLSATHASKSHGIDTEHLSQTWRIDLETVKKTIDITSQQSTRTDNPTLSQNYGTGDRMLRYRRINEYFFMDTFFATKSAGKSSRGHSCCQLFVTDKGFVYVVPMKSKSEVLQAVKQFAKEIGAPDAIISDAAGEQSSRK